MVRENPGAIGSPACRSNHVAELLRETVAGLLFRAPRGPPLLADIAVPGEDLSQRPWRETAPSQQHLQSLAQCGLGMREPLAQLSKPGRACSRLGQPAPQGLPRQVAAFAVTQPDSVDD